MSAVPALIGIGGAHPDRTARLLGAHLPHTSNPVVMRETIGGGVFNALRAASMGGLASVAIVSTRGGDSAGQAVGDAIAASGISDLSGVHLDRATPSYTAILDRKGDLVTAVADMMLYETGLARHIRRKPLRQAVAQARAVLMDANLPSDALERLAGDATGTVFAMAISAAKATRLRRIAQRIDVAFANIHEIRALSGETGETAAMASSLITQRGMRALVVTQGGGPVIVANGDGITSIDPPDVPITDVTGAGDALAGATIAALLREPAMPLVSAVREGIAAAALTVQVNGPVAGTLTGEGFETILGTIRASNPLEKHSA